MRLARIVVLASSALMIGGSGSALAQDGRKASAVLERLILTKDTLPAGFEVAKLPRGELPPAIDRNPMISSEPAFIKALIEISGPGMGGGAKGARRGLLAVYQERSLILLFALEFESDAAALAFKPVVEKAMGMPDPDAPLDVLHAGKVVVWTFSKANSIEPGFLAVRDHAKQVLGLAPGGADKARGAASEADLIARARAAWEKGDVAAAERLIQWEGTPPEIARKVKGFMMPEAAVPAGQLTVKIEPLPAERQKPMELDGKVYELNVNVTGVLVIATNDGKGNTSKVTIPVGKHADGRYYFAAARPRK